MRWELMVDQGKKCTTWQAIAYKCPTLYLKVAVKHTMNFTSCIVHECECYTCTNGTLKKRSASLIPRGVRDRNPHMNLKDIGIPQI